MNGNTNVAIALPLGAFLVRVYPAAVHHRTGFAGQWIMVAHLRVAG